MRWTQQLWGQVVIVTGASAGIGRATAVLLAQSGAYVMMVARRRERLAELAAQLADAPGQCRWVAGDIADETFCQQVVADTMAAWGRVDVLINNAGVGHNGRLAEMSPADIDRLLATNIRGLLLLTQTAVPIMQAQRSGHIINISSIVGQRPLPLSGLYCASKTAVNFISRTLHMELKQDGIRVSTVYPGRTQTEFGTALLGAPRRNRFAFGRVSAERAAEAIVRTIGNRHTDVFVTRFDWGFTHLNRLFPRSIDAMLTLLTRRLS